MLPSSESSGRQKNPLLQGHQPTNVTELVFTRFKLGLTTYILIRLHRGFSRFGIIGVRQVGTVASFGLGILLLLHLDATFALALPDWLGTFQRA